MSDIDQQHPGATVIDVLDKRMETMRANPGTTTTRDWIELACDYRRVAIVKQALAEHQAELVAWTNNANRALLDKYGIRGSVIKIRPMYDFHGTLVPIKPYMHSFEFDQSTQSHDE